MSRRSFSTILLVVLFVLGSFSPVKAEKSNIGAIAPPTNIRFGTPIPFPVEAGHGFVSPLGSVVAGAQGDDTSVLVTIDDTIEGGLKIGATTYTGIYIGSNGYITFEGPETSYNPIGIPGYTNGPMIAGQYDDINPSNGGTVYIYEDDANDRVTVTWYQVAPYETPTDGFGVNTFQIRLHGLWDGIGDGAGDFGIEIRYDTINWTRGMPADPGDYPTGGWTVGDGVTFGEVTDSGTADFITIEDETNIDHPGVFAWGVYDGGVEEIDESIPENSPAGTLVAPLTADDDGPSSELVFILLDDDGGNFEIFQDAGVYKVRVAAGATLDYETSPGHLRQIHVLVTDQESPPSSSSAWLDIPLTDVNEMPIITEGSSISVTMSEDGSPTPFDLTLHATDPDSGDTLSWSISSAASHGSASASGTGTSKVIGYSPTANYNGSDSFNVQVDDGNGGTDEITVNVTIESVQDPPIANDDAVSTDEDTAFTTIDLVADNDTDPDPGDTLSVTGIDTTGTTGLVTDNGNGTFDYDPNGQFESLAVGDSATDTFTYTISDGNGGSDSATVTVTINGANDGPTAVDDAVSTDEDTAFTTADLVAANDTDPDVGDTLTVTGIDTTGTTGLVTDNGDGTFDYDPNGQFESLAVGDSATDTFTYTISDGNGGSDSATVTVTVNGANDAPTAVDDVDNTDEDNSVTVGVRSNDSDPDTSDTLSVSGINTSGTTGQVTNNGTDVTYDPNGQFESLGAGDSATDTFTYTISDGNGGSDSATVTVTIHGANDGPNAVDDAVSTDEDTAFTTADLVADNDTDPDPGDILTVTGIDTTGTTGLVTDNGDGTFDYDPNGQFESLAVGDSAMDTFTYTISDGNGGSDSATVTVTINGENDNPNADDDSDATQEDTPVTVDVLLNDDDVDTGDSLTVSAVTNGSHGSVTNNGSDVTYDPDPNYFGIDTFTYTVEDSQGGTDTATVTITVSETDDMVVLGNSLVITDGDATPSTTDDTDFGSTSLFLGTVEHTFTIENRGNIDLVLTGSPRVAVSGAHASDFTVTTQPASPITSGGTTTFSVEFDPSAEGVRTAEISIDYDDDPNPYTFSIQGTATTNDTDNDGIEDNVEGDGDRDGDGVPNYQDYDPTGYFYDEADGEIISGGAVSVSGPGAVTIVQSGSGGYYQFVTDGTAGTYTMAVALPPGYEWSDTCLQGDPPPFDPTGLAEPVVLGNGENGTTGFLTSNACTAFYLTFDLAGGDPTIINNNIPLQVRSLPDTGFAPGVLTELAEQTAEKTYHKLSGLWLDVPSIGVRAPLVGVPTVNGEWDVTWLGNQAGYLIGTAFPTWEGNTVITGHVWNPDNQPGIFVDLKTLRYGDQIHIHAWGEIYTYQIQTNRLISPHVPKSVLEHKDGDWVTLFTCEEYGQFWGDYGYRRMVQAVLVSIIAAE